MNNEEMITGKELAEKMKVTRQAVALWVNNGCPYETRIPLRFLWSDVKEWLKNRKKGQ